MGDNMNKVIVKKKKKKNKYKYIFLITIIVLGIISGIILSNLLSYNDSKEISKIIEEYLINLKNGNNLNFISNLINSLSINFLYVLLIFIFSLSIIGILLNPFILYFKSFITGFSIGIMIKLYSFKGILLGIFSVFPHEFINLILYLFISFYGIKLSIKLFFLIFTKKQFNFSFYMKKYLKVIGVSLILLIISSLYETFIADFVIKAFTFLIKWCII